ncbi:hypothetical protein HYQ45_007502 [Verticillium longisporum]|uniref:Uncharacterized protein n=1 Tax=Verticillium longisporum TaxID=100787 RepID=A0A8I2ZLZ5_VERLO|nr:hypothetical protein HYQ45_007502 [Verticillium longisporum]
MCVTLPTRSMQAVISRAVPDVTVQHVQPVSSLRSQRLYDVECTNGTNLAIALPAMPMARLLRSEQGSISSEANGTNLAIALPAMPMARLLRSEQGSISSEAAVLKWLAGLHVKKPLLQERTPEPEETRVVLSRDGKHVRSPSTSSSDDHSTSTRLATFLPQLLLHSAGSNEHRIEYNVTRPTQGKPIADLSPPLNPSERKLVDLQTGHFCRRVSELVSPTGRFGPAFAVLPTLTPSHSGALTPSARRDANARMIQSKGVETWATAFHSMLEAVLRDGEDMAVMLAYANVRRQYRRLAHVLEGVTCSRLVAVDAGDNMNTLVLRKARPGTPATDDDDDDSEDEEDRKTETGSSQAGEDDEQKEEEDKTALEAPHDITMTGMKDWSHFIFGDPLFATVFSRDATDEFFRGFNDAAAGHEADGESNEPQTKFDSVLIEDKANAHVRLLLYDCYHTITQVVREFYRPRKDSSRHELAARKRLNDILTRLEAIGEPKPTLRRKRSGEMSPAKRAKSEGPEDA